MPSQNKSPSPLLSVGRRSVFHRELERGEIESACSNTLKRTENILLVWQSAALIKRQTAPTNSTLPVSGELMPVGAVHAMYTGVRVCVLLCFIRTDVDVV